MKPRYGRHARSSQPFFYLLQDFDISRNRTIEARGVNDDHTIVLEAWKPIAWIDDHRFNIGRVRGQRMTDLHLNFSKEGIYELCPSGVRLEVQRKGKSSLTVLLPAPVAPITL